MKSSSQEKLDDLEIQYLQYLRRDTEFHQSIKEVEEFKIPLVSTFVMLHASPRDTVGDDNNFSMDVQNSSKNKAEAAKQESPKISLSISTLLQEHQNIVLIGEPGSGKTTTLQFIAYSFGKDTAYESLGLQKRLIPVIIRLRDIAEAGEYLNRTQVDDWLLNIVSSAIQAEISLVRNLVNRWRDSGRLFILFDGLDEVKEAFRFEIAKKIKHFCDLTIDSDVKIIVTSRKDGFRGIGSNFHEYELQPLSENIELFIENWIQALQKDFSGEAVKDKARVLVRQIREKLRGKQVMNNPLFLRLLIFQFINSGEISETRSDVIDYFVKDELWERARKRTSHPPSLDMVMIALEYLAWESHTKEESDYENLLKKIQSDVKDLEDAREILNFIAMEMGLINFSSQFPKKQIRFTHVLLREYFVARCIKKSWELDENKTWLFLKPLLHLPNWKEPLILLLNMLDEDNASKIIKQVWNSKSPSEEWLRRDTLLVGEFLRNGAVKNEQLRHRILESLLHLYIQHKKTDELFGDSMRLNHIVAEPIASIFITLPSIDQSYLASLSLQIAKGDEHLIKPSIKGFVLFLNNDFRTIKHLVSYYDSDKSQFFQIFSKLLRNILLPIVWIIRFFTIPLSIPKYLNQIKTERSKNCTSAIETISLFDHVSSEWIDFLVLGLKNPELVGVAAKILGEKAPRSEKIIQPFIGLLHTDIYFSSNPINEIGMPIGIYCQRHPVLINTLITLVKNTETKPRVRYRSIIALCKAAEVSIEALGFVFETSKYIQENPGTVYDDGTADGYNDGIDSISVPSKDVVLYLLNLHGDYGGGRILHNIFGVYGSKNVKEENAQSLDELSTQNKFEKEAKTTTVQNIDSPVIQCKIILSDGTIRYSSEDFTEYVFASFLNSPRKIFMGNSSLDILIHWGWRRPYLIKRLINTILDSNPYILAQELQDSMSDKNFGQLIYFKQPIEDEMRDFIQKDIEQLRGNNSSTRQDVYQKWIKALEKQVPQEVAFYSYHDIFERMKLNILADLYNVASGQICKNSDTFNWNLSNKIAASIFSALINFRSVERILSVSPRPPDGVIKKIQFRLADKALSILDDPDVTKNNIIDNLIELVQNKPPQIPYEDELFEGVIEDSNYWRARGLSQFLNRMSGAFMLSVFAEDNIEIQDLLYSILDLNYLEKEERSDTFSEAIFEIVRRIKNANPKIVVALLDISSNKKIYFARDTFRNFSHPSLDSVPVLVDSIKKLDRFNQRTILEALGSVDHPTLGLVDELLRHLRSYSEHLRSSASSALGKIIEKGFDETGSENKEKWSSKTFEVFDQLIKVSSKTPMAAISLGNLAQRIGTLDKDTAKKQLSKAVNRINKILRRTSLQEFDISYALGELSFEKTVNALGKVVAQITLSETRFLSNNLPVNIWSDIKLGNTSLQKVSTKPYSWIYKSPLLLIVSAVYFVISILIPKLLENLIPTTKLNWGTSLLLVGGLLIIYSIIDIWLRRKEK